MKGETNQGKYPPFCETSDLDETWGSALGIFPEVNPRLFILSLFFPCQRVIMKLGVVMLKKKNREKKTSIIAKKL